MDTRFDFGDGAGPVAAHRHANGGGWVADTARVEVSAYVSEEARVSGEARVFGRARVSGQALVSGQAQVFGQARVSGEARVSGRAWVQSQGDWAIVGPLGTRNAFLTLTKTTTTPRYVTGCFAGTFQELHAASLATHGRTSPHYHAYGAAAAALWRLVMGTTPIPTVQE